MKIPTAMDAVKKIIPADGEPVIPALIRLLRMVGKSRTITPGRIVYIKIK